MIKRLLFITLSFMMCNVLIAQVANQPIPMELCDGDVSDEIEEFDLSFKNAEILGAQNPSDFSVSYFLTQADADSDVNPLPILFTNSLNPQTVYVRVEEISSGSFDTTTLTLRVLPNPAPGTPSDIVVCDDESNDGFAIFDLTFNDLQIINGEVGNSVSYYNTESDAIFGSNVIADPTMYINITASFQTIYARLENDVTGCFAITDFSISVNPLPASIAVSDFLICESNTDGFAAFDLETKVSEILNGQDPSNFTVTFHSSQSEADQQINALVSPYVNTNNPQVIYIALTNNSIGCSSTSMSFNLEVQESAEANPDGIPIVYEICDDNSETDGDTTNDSTSFDLSNLDSDILDGQNPGSVNVSYYATEADANMGVNPLPINYNNTINPQVIYARATNMQCFDLTPVTLQVNVLPLSGLDENYVFCEGESLVIDSGVDTSLYIIEWYSDGFIINGENSATLTVFEAGPFTYTCIDIATGCSSTVNITVTAIDCTDTDGDGVIDTEEDLNNNGNFDDDDTDMDGIPNYMDDDDDNDGVLTIDEDYNNNGDPTDDDTDMSGTADYLEMNVALSIDEVVFSGFELFPNPTKHAISIQLNSTNSGKAAVSIFDIQGKLILNQDLSDGNRNHIDVSNFQSGLYFVEVNVNNKSMVEKLIIE